MIRYDKYKQSGIEWLGEIPEHWEFDRIKNIGTVNGRVGWKALKATEYVDSGYFFLSTPNIKHVEIDYSNVNYITHARYFESPEIMLRNEDVLLVKDGSTLGIVNIVKKLPAEGTVNSSIAVLRFRNKINRYIFYLLKSNFTQETIRLKKEGMGVPHLFQRDINNFTVLLPPLPEQKTIANYLDQKTTAIDKKIALLEKKIEHYKELRKSLINQTVTKGLDKNVKLKHSGVEWIGEIPEHWEVKRGKKLFTEIKVKSITGQGDLLSVSEYYGVAKKKDVIEEDDYITRADSLADYKKCKTGDLVINIMLAWKRGLGVTQSDGLVSPAYAVFRFNKKLIPNYYHYLLRTDDYISEFKRNSKGIIESRLRLYSDKFFDVKFLIPSLKEQIEITNYLDEQTSKIDQITNNLQAQIEQLKELRKVLINDVVTGKIKVV